MWIHGAAPANVNLEFRTATVSVDQRRDHDQVHPPHPLEEENPMAIEISAESRTAALHSLERYFEANMDEPLGNLAAHGLLEFILPEIGPLVYNQALEAAKERLVARAMDVESELYQELFTYWRNAARNKRDR
jgi:uncharacterized protein (DUF2164 family)